VDAAEARATLEIDSDFERNLILNGSLQYWPEGTSFAAAATGTYSAENWQYRKVGAMVHTLSRDTDVPSVGDAGYRIPYSLLATLTTADTSIAAGDFCVLESFLEGYKFSSYSQRALTFHVWVKASLAGVYCMYAQNSGADRSFVGEFTINAIDTWERKKITLAASPSAGTWDYTNGIGLRIGVCLAAGATFRGTNDVWNTGPILASAAQVNGVNTGSTLFRIADARLGPGSTPEKMPMERYPDVEWEGQRYCQFVGPESPSTEGYFPLVYVFSGSQFSGMFPSRRQMRALSTVSSVATLALSNGITEHSVSSIGPSASDGKGTLSFGVFGSFGLFAAGDILLMRVSGGPSVKFSARFT
jgi:hypothetical protein